MLTQNNKNVNKILLTGGGTGGSVSPLLAIVNQLKNTPFMKGGGGGFDFLFIGSKNGPEKEMVEKEGIGFKAISSGKLRRYFSVKNILDLFFIIVGFFESIFIILKWKPDLIISAGSFVSVPVIWAGWILRVPILIHQQDVRAGLANKLMAPFAKVITVTFEESLRDYGEKAVWTGNPTRQLTINNYQLSINEIKKKFELHNDLPVVLVIGGGTGAMAINELVWESLDELTKFCRIIHITGKGKNKEQEAKNKEHNYKSFEFLNAEQMAEAYAAADIVVSRAGMGVLTELSYLGKSTILIPIPDSHQEDNAKIFKNKDAAIVLSQKGLDSKVFTENIKKLLDNKDLRDKLGENIKDAVKSGADQKIAEIISKIIK